MLNKSIWLFNICSLKTVNKGFNRQRKLLLGLSRLKEIEIYQIKGQDMKLQATFEN